MSGIYTKDGRIYYRVKLLKDGKLKWGGVPSDFRPGQEKQAKAALAKAEARRKAGEVVTGAPGPVTVRSFYEVWLEARKEHVGTWSNDEGVMRLHVLPAIGTMRLDAVRPLHLVQLVKELRRKPVERKYADERVRKLSPKSLYNIYGTISAFFRDAKLEDLVNESPCILTKHQLGYKGDSDPEWRATAIYTRLELERLISDELVPMDRRVWYGLEGIGALRLGEAAGLRFRNLTEGDPLGMIIVARSYDRTRTKTGDTRYMPIHPTLAAMLAEWRLHGWKEMMGRTPTEDDLVVPLPMDLVQRNQNKARPGGMRNKGDAYRDLKLDLARLEMRHRRGHDLRRTMISLARSDGARVDILKRGTHKPPKEVIEGYTTFEWDVLCREVAKFKISRRRTADVVALPRAAAGGGEGFATDLATVAANSTESNDKQRGATRIRTALADLRLPAFMEAQRGFSGGSPIDHGQESEERRGTGGDRRSNVANPLSKLARDRLLSLLDRLPPGPTPGCARCAEPVPALLRRGREAA